ncbi:hypothetical protein GCM10029992_34460 [Glycomyces albus]
MFGRADQVGVAGVGEGVLEQAEFELLGQDAVDGVVDAVGVDASGLDLGQERVDETLVFERHHDHVDPGVDRRAHRLGVVGADLVDTLPVGEHNAVEAEFALEHVGDQVGVGVGLDRSVAEVVAGIGDHDGADPGFHGGLERRQVEAAQLGLAQFGDALVEQVVPGLGGAVLGAAVADVVLGGGQDAGARGQVVALVAGDGGGHLGYQFGVFAEGLIGAAPAGVADDAQARREGPVDSGHAGLGSGDGGGLLGQGGVAGGAEADVVREDRGPRQEALPCTASRP